MCALSCKARARNCCIEGGTRFGFARNFKLDRSSPCHSVRVFTPILSLFAQSSVLERPNICVVISNFLCNVFLLLCFIAAHCGSFNQHHLLASVLVVDAEFSLPLFSFSSPHMWT